MFRPLPFANPAPLILTLRAHDVVAASILFDEFPTPWTWFGVCCYPVRSLRFILLLFAPVRHLLTRRGAVIISTASEAKLVGTTLTFDGMVTAAHLVRHRVKDKRLTRRSRAAPNELMLFRVHIEQISTVSRHCFTLFTKNRGERKFTTELLTPSCWAADSDGGRTGVLEVKKEMVPPAFLADLVAAGK